MTKELNLLEVQIENKNKKEEVDEEVNFEPIDEKIRLHVKKVIEALLFSCSDPLALNKIREVLDTFCSLTPRQIRQTIEELQQDFIGQKRAYKLEEIAQGYALRTHEEYAPYIQILRHQRRYDKLSPAATEVLAIIAYRQPVTRPQIDAIRGVDSSGTLMQLLERQLVEQQGKLEAPGRPSLYGTTKEFLKHFGFKDLHCLKNGFNHSE